MRVAFFVVPAAVGLDDVIDVPVESRNGCLAAVDEPTLGMAGTLTVQIEGGRGAPAASAGQPSNIAFD